MFDARAAITFSACCTGSDSSSSLCEALNEAEEEEEEEDDDDDDDEDEEEEAEGLEAVASFINLPCSRISLRIVSRSALPSSYLQ